jgi:hypothetical protein
LSPTIKKKAVKIEEENFGLKTEPRTKVIDVVNHFEAPHEYKTNQKKEIKKIIKNQTHSPNYSELVISCFSSY